VTRVTVTGSTGLLGRAVVTALQDNRDVEVWTAARGGEPRERHVVADLTRPDDARAVAATRPDVVIHLAAVNRGDVPTMFRTNVVGTTNLLRCLGEGTHVVQTGSSAEYAPMKMRIAEGAPLGPLTAYGWSKVAQTISAQAAAEEHSLRIAILRPFNVVSPELPATSALGNARRQLLAGARGPIVHLRVGRLDIVRDYVPVRYVAEAIVAIALDPMVSGVYNVCSGSGLRLDAVLDALAERAGARLRMQPDPELIGIAGAESVVGDPTKLETLLGCSIRPTPGDVAAWVTGDEVATGRATVTAQSPDGDA
jgi:GDP-4-dehydro-6-deoxy-D-mannose reductase